MAEAARRLLWLHQYFVGSAAAGGERSRITLEGLIARGWQVKLISASDGYQESGAVGGGIERDGALLWHRIPLRASGPDARARSYWEFFRRGLAAGGRGFRPDLVFCSSPPLTQTAAAVLLARRWRAPIVLEVRDLWPTFLDELRLVRSPAALAALRRMELLAYRSASAIVSASPAFRPYLEARGVAPEAIADAPHGARRRDLGALRTSGRAFRAAHGLGDRPILLHAGSLHDHYGLDTWLAAAAMLSWERPDAVFVVAGGGRGQGRVEAAARSGANLIYLGPVPRAALDGAIGAADLGLVCLSRAASFASVLPGKLVDLMSCGVPVVTTVAGQAARLVERAGAGWSARDEPADLLRAIRLGLAAGPAARTRKGEAGRRFVMLHLPAEAQAKAVADACEAALAAPKPASRHIWSALRAPAADPAAALFHRDGGVLAADAFDAWLTAAVRRS